MKKMKKKIAVGMFLVLAMAFALGFEAIDRPSVSVSAEVYSPNETEDENTTWIKAEIEKFKKVPEMSLGWQYTKHKRKSCSGFTGSHQRTSSYIAR
jgi:hypothetical protein